MHSPPPTPSQGKKASGAAVSAVFTNKILEKESVQQIEDMGVLAMAHELRQLVDTANAPIFGIDTDGLVNEWNNKTVEITGFSKEEAFGEPLVNTFIKNNLRKQVQSVMTNAIMGNETSNYELEFDTKTGETVYLLVNATTRRDPDGQIIGVVGVAQVRCCFGRVAWALYVIHFYLTRLAPLARSRRTSPRPSTTRTPTSPWLESSVSSSIPRTLPFSELMRMD